MRYFAFATDYDGTLATDGRVDDATLDAVRRLKASGRRALLVTGRRLDDLERVFPEHALFDRIVAENGAVLYDPLEKTLRLLEDPPPPSSSSDSVPAASRRSTLDTSSSPPGSPTRPSSSTPSARWASSSTSSSTRAPSW